MKANPGGQIDTKSVIGRDRLIRLLWETVELQSLVITAERRIGKTTVIKKMRDEPTRGWVPVFQDLERCHSAAEFAMAVYKEIHQFLSGKGKVTRRAKELFEALGGTEVGGLFKLPEKAGAQWKDVLTRAVEDLIHENDAAGTRLLFLWDEVPFMLANIRDREGEQTAMEVLDLLRALRQTHAGLRMVITGSIGLHHVLSSLKDKNYANSPTNDMVAIDVPPLSEPDAVRLAGLLIDGEALPSPDQPAVAAAIAREADCFPFYIHHIVKALKIRGLDATPDNVSRVVASQLVDANDPWELLHYRERIPIYYGDDQKAVSLLLDQLAVQPGTASVNELLAMLKGAGQFDDRDRLLRLLSLMERDHYLKRDEDGRYQFRFPLIRRWWKLHRGL
ncbi:MAG: AAA family ATPase [Chthoniobacteraceae bacterium]